MAPHLRGKMPKVPEKITMPDANYSSAATVVPVMFEPPPSSPLPKENCFVASSNECLTPTLVRQGPDCPANLATKPRTANLSMLLEEMFVICLPHNAFFFYSLKLLNGSVQRMWLSSI
jgi:hypothetical protein